MTTWTANQDQLKLFNQIADDFKKTHPEIKSITFDSLPPADYSTTLTTQLAGGDAPDLAWVFDTDATDYVNSGTLAPLTSTLKATAGYDYSDLSSSATKLWTAKGQLYAYPFSTSPFIVFANDSLLSQAGLPTSAQMKANGTWTWPDIMQAASQVNAKTGKGGVVVNNFNYQDWTTLVGIWNSFGAAPWSSNGKTCTFDSPEMESAFSLINKAIRDKAMPGPGTTVDFFSGGAAFEVAQISSAGLLAKAGFKWDVNPLPAAKDGAAANVIGQAGLGVIAKGKNAEEASKFLAFFTNPDNAKKLAAYFPPPRTSLQTADTLAATNPVLSADQLNNVVIKSLSDAVTRPGHVNQAQIAKKVQTALTPMWKPNADVSGILKNVCSSVKPLLEG
ncbi:sugar ABC transporter substrate-binding protein [Gryllotalpicola koreensis]|uniref:Sugar ABC transporter substrate-binding protein n=2 Tax=Gryllotalpicola koreensis TaxID=993086 RepID=A0ABP8A106_9MICO